MIGIVGLDERPSLDVAPPCPSRHLAEQLEGPFAGARIGCFERQIGVDHADQRQLGKMMPLGHELRADDEIMSPGGDLAQRFLERRTPNEIARQDDETRLRP